MSDRSAVLALLVRLLEEETGQPAPPFDETTDLRAGLGLDSVDLVGLVMRVEGHYRIRLTHPELSAVTTVGGLLDLVAAKLAGLDGAAAA
jgi:acyl carrier protein